MKLFQFKCCGVDSWEDFKAAPKWNGTMPKACCVLEGDIAKFQPANKNCPEYPSDSNSFWKMASFKHSFFSSS